MANTLLSYLEKGKIEAGCDEAGRGCLAGPVYAAAVILPVDFFHPLLNDSKQLSEKERELLRPIIEKEAIAWGVAWADAGEIDNINILNAAILSMHRAIGKLAVSPDLLLIDGNRFKPYGNILHKCIVGGDGKFASIAAASVLAKSYRDSFMREIAAEFPLYGWDKNMAYPTKLHREAIRKFGSTKYHRMSFRLL
ncbi:MAG: ribonuclease HII [Bacteroidetes bacterium GWE2_39_28]|nr:MAG: ribonuclease HII [Bacteroidetes bacterium GWE2_39_28]OFY12041.1 MAG: ribonuclease HII [Bacteroidetes bacterium GWF2_39_10]OFZ09021.1 MAG: ribonuclease HII [Bacteroidetes bacterium RIFOXYB2_FULL_39_7]OFZ11296.1 MAG: ribonuclease HII [Bacteroidetes bacterium RIFOXYC2_FULL_39_11]HCT95149.1 ribonuclease HII [Rikenellaceae bacterium]